MVLGQMLFNFVGYLMLIALAILALGLIMMLLSMIVGFIDDFILDGKLSPIIKGSIRKLFRVA